MKSEVKVSVCVVAYNQESYIAECLQGLVDQETNFKFEIIVGEDNSTDNTGTIVKAFQEKYPDLVFPILHKENVGAVKNCIATYKAAKGEYICHMDGDDAVLPGKLQEQADVLDRNQDCIMCTHNAVVVDKGSRLISESLRRKGEGKYSLADLYKDLPFFTNSTKMFKVQGGLDCLDYLHGDAVDAELHVEQAKNGLIYHLDKPLGVYRSLVGISSSLGSVNPLVASGYKRLYENALRESSVDIGLTKQDLLGCYAKSMLGFSYQSLFFGKNKDAKDFAKASLRIRRFSPLQYLLIFLSYLGPIPVFLVRIRNKYK